MEAGANGSSTQWRLPVGAVLAAAIASLLLGSAERLPRFEAAYSVHIKRPLTADQRAELDRLLSGVPESIAVERLETDWPREQVLRLFYSGDERSGIDLARSVAQQIAVDLRREPLTDQQRDERLYEIDTQLADLRLSPVAPEQAAAGIEPLLVERDHLLSSAEGVVSRPRVRLVRTTHRPASAWLVAAPVLLVAVFLAGAVRLIRPRRRDVVRDPVQATLRLATPTRVVTTAPRRAA